MLCFSIVGFIFLSVLANQIEANGVEIKKQRFTNFGVQQKLLKELLSPNYDGRIQPFDPNGTASQTTFATVNMYVRSIDSVDDIKRELNVQITFRMQWKDERLIYSHKPDRHNFPYISTNSNSGVWIPDIFFTNEKKGQLHDIITSNAYIRIYPDGQVLFSVRVSLALRCLMNFKMYPFDTQNCSIRFASYGKTVDNLVLLWKMREPVQVTKDVDLPVFHLQNHTTSYCNSETETGVYSCLNVAFIFKRKVNSYLIHVYIPTTMMVILAWLTFWLNHQGNEALARILMATIILLVMATQIAKFAETFPLASHTRSIDIWIGVCRTFVFTVVLELIVVQYLQRNQSETLKDVENLPKQKTLGAKIDFCARIAYPALFVVFTIIYVWSFAL